MNASELFVPQREMREFEDSVHLIPLGHSLLQVPTLTFHKNTNNITANTIDVAGDKLLQSFQIWACLGIFDCFGVRHLLVVTDANYVGHILGSPVFCIQKVVSICIDTNSNELLRGYRSRRQCLFMVTELLSAGQHYFSHGYDLSSRFQRTALARKNHMKSPSYCGWNRKYVWNMHMLTALLKTRAYFWCTPVIQGSVTCEVLNVESAKLHCVLIARRDKRRVGARRFCRGLNSFGECAAMVESEQFVISYNSGATHTAVVAAHVQVRGSIPLLWKPQSRWPSSSFTVEKDLKASATAARIHFRELQREYGDVMCLCLLEKRGEQQRLGATTLSVLHALSAEEKQFEKHTCDAHTQSVSASSLDDGCISSAEMMGPSVLFLWFDFHDYVRSQDSIQQVSVELMQTRTALTFPNRSGLPTSLGSWLDSSQFSLASIDMDVDLPPCRGILEYSHTNSHTSTGRKIDTNAYTHTHTQKSYERKTKETWGVYGGPEWSTVQVVCLQSGVVRVCV
eukprot:GHVR01114421.1.p1 GENE.GHVR01114421.1~~GHVR01114421.1.p1  ORF type:complete len:510 (-),score=105.01 GHVR01114421.1:45-1574(-)